MQITFIRLVKNNKIAVNIKVISKTKAELYYGERMKGNQCGFIQEISSSKAKKYFYYYLQNGYTFENGPKKTNKIDYQGVSLRTLLEAVKAGKQKATVLKKYLTANLKLRLEIDIENATTFYEQSIKDIYLKTPKGNEYLLKVAQDYIDTFDCK